MKRPIALLFILLCAVASCKTHRKATSTSSGKTTTTTSAASYKGIAASAGVDDASHKPKTTFHQDEELKIYWDLQREGSSCHNCGPVSYEIVRKESTNARSQLIVAPTLTSDWPIKLLLSAKHFAQGGRYLVHVFLPNSSVSTDFSFTID